MKHRIERVNSLIQEELGKIIIKEFEFPNILVTITFVITMKDMDSAVVYFSSIPFEKSKDALAILNRNVSHLQYLLMKKMNIRPMPRISFKIDTGSEKAVEVESIIEKISSED